MPAVFRYSLSNTCSTGLRPSSVPAALIPVAVRICQPVSVPFSFIAQINRAVPPGGNSAARTTPAAGPTCWSVFTFGFTPGKASFIVGV